MTTDKKCGRPHCKNTEYRIDGYCSMYCRDVHDLETQLTASRAEVERLRTELEEYSYKGKVYNYKGEEI